MDRERGYSGKILLIMALARPTSGRPFPCPIRFRKVAACQTYENGLSLLDVVDNRLPRSRPIPSSDGIDNGPMQAPEAHFLPLDANRTRHVIGEPPGPLKD